MYQNCLVDRPVKTYISLSLSLLCQTHTNPNHTLSLLNIFSHQPSLTTLQYYHLGVCLCIFFVWIINLYKVVALLGQLTDLPQSHLTFFLSLSLFLPHLQVCHITFSSFLNFFSHFLFLLLFLFYFFGIKGVLIFLAQMANSPFCLFSIFGIQK